MRNDTRAVDMVEMGVCAGICVKALEWLDNNSDFKYTEERKNLWDDVQTTVKALSKNFGVMFNTGTIELDTFGRVDEVLNLYHEFAQEVQIIVGDAADDTHDDIYKCWLLALKDTIKKERVSIREFSREEKNRQKETMRDEFVPMPNINRDPNRMPVVNE